MSDNLRSTAAVIAGSFSDYRLVKSRGVLQLVVEIPVEQQGDAFAALGYPIPGTDIPVAVARLNSPVGPHSPQHERTTSAALDGRANPKPTGEPQRQRYAAMSPAEQAVTRAAMLPKDERFRAWVTSKYRPDGQDAIDEQSAAFSIRNICCDGNSRKLIAEVPEYLDRFLAMETEFKMDVGELARPR